MTVAACLSEINRIVGRELTENEQQELGEALGRIQQRIRNEEAGEAAEEAVMKAVEDFTDDMVAAAMIEKRNAYFNKRAQLELEGYLNQVWGFGNTEGRVDYGEGVQAFLGGSLVARAQSKRSVAADQDNLGHQYTMGLLARLKKEGVYELAVKGKMDEQIWTAMWELNQIEPDAAALGRLPPEAVTVAKIMNDYNEKARIDANRAGAWIKKLPGYVVRRSHDQWKIAKAAGGMLRRDDPRHFEAWKADVADKLDWERTFPDMDPSNREQLLKELYNQFASGTHVKFGEGGASGFKGFANIGRKMSHERVLHFKSAKDDFEYHQKYGAGTLMESMVYGLEHMARDTALMRRMGPNAEMNLDAVLNRIAHRIKKEGTAADLDKFDKKVQKLKRTLWPNITGEAAVAVNADFAGWSMAVRNVETMADLGAAALSSVSDAAFAGASVRYQGGSQLQGMAEAITSWFRGRPTTEQLEMAADLGVFVDGLKAPVASRFDVSDSIPGRSSRAVQKFFKFNLLRDMTDRVRLSFTMSRAHNLARNAGKELSELHPRLQAVLRQYGIEDAEWNLLRQGKLRADDGRHYLLPEGLDDVPDAAFAAYLEAKGRKPTAAKIRDLREDLKGRYRSYHFDQATGAVLEPGKMERAIALQGTRPGTPVGEGLRHLMLYKSFVISVMRKVMGRELWGYGADRLPLHRQIMHALSNPVGAPMVGLANVMLWSTAMGYVALSLKDLAKGREPRVPQDAAGYRDLFFASMVQGGGMGVYGDFLFGEVKNRFGNNFSTTLMGPTARRVNDLADLYGRFRSGDDMAAAAFRNIINNAPGNNLFYARTALDYLFLHRITEGLNPGYLRRMERRLKSDMDQEFIIPPSTVIPHGGGL